MRWGNLCAAHRKPVRERDEKRDAVVVWATANFERLAGMMEKEEAEQKAAYIAAMQNNLGQLYASQAHQQAGLCQGLLATSATPQPFPGA